MSQSMPPFDYNAPAELFLAKRTKSRQENYRRFGTAAEVIRYAVEDLRAAKAFGAWLEVGDERFNSTEIQRLYEAADYPLQKPV
jgi:Arc/MetJ-type ribon-helix-helix transcriptional regulator